MTRQSPRKYTEEFKKEAVKLVVEHGYTQTEAAESLGIPSKNLSRWVNIKEKTKKEPLNTEQNEINALRKQVQKLQLEKEILKKAAAFFANELK